MDNHIDETVLKTILRKLYFEQEQFIEPILDDLELIVQKERGL